MTYDSAGVEKASRDLLVAIGEDPEREGLVGTPDRMARVVIEAEHMCMSMRGISKPGSSTVTSALRGIMNDGATRAEMMALVLSGSR